MTTLMVRNLPEMVSQQEVVEELNRSGFAGLFDFCYAPIKSFQTRRSAGFAFVNFITPVAAQEFKSRWHRSRRFGMQRDSRTLDVSPAIVQGKEANMAGAGTSRIRRIRNTAFKPFVAGESGGAGCSSEEQLPRPRKGRAARAASAAAARAAAGEEGGVDERPAAQRKAGKEKMSQERARAGSGGHPEDCSSDAAPRASGSQRSGGAGGTAHATSAALSAASSTQVVAPRAAEEAAHAASPLPPGAVLARAVAPPLHPTVVQVSVTSPAVFAAAALGPVVPWVLPGAAAAAAMPAVARVPGLQLPMSSPAPCDQGPGARAASAAAPAPTVPGGGGAAASAVEPPGVEASGGDLGLLSTQVLVSTGSIGHPWMCGPRCKYAAKDRGCKDGLMCDHCHLCALSGAPRVSVVRLGPVPAEVGAVARGCARGRKRNSGAAAPAANAIAAPPSSSAAVGAATPGCGPQQQATQLPAGRRSA